MNWSACKQGLVLLWRANAYANTARRSPPLQRAYADVLLAQCFCQCGGFLTDVAIHKIGPGWNDPKAQLRQSCAKNLRLLRVTNKRALDVSPVVHGGERRALRHRGDRKSVPQARAILHQLSRTQPIPDAQPCQAVHFRKCFQDDNILASA